MTKTQLLGAAITAALAMAGAAAQAADRPTCGDILRVPIENGALTSARVVEAGKLSTVPEIAAGLAGRQLETAPGKAQRGAPAFCRVQGVLHPSKTSGIRFEVWLPVDGWNTRYWGVGNGGTSGFIAYADMLQAVSRGYATSSTNTGHDNGMSSAEAFADPERAIDFGYRATHLTAVVAKQLVGAYYGAKPEKSYFSGCSNGGRQGLLEAARFPEDYDGVIAGAPAATFPGIPRSAFLADYLMADPARLFTPQKLETLQKAVVAQCDKQDGVVDGLISAPMQCKLDPAKLLCKGEDKGTCLTAAQVETARTFYTSMGAARGQNYFDQMLPGTEQYWYWNDILATADGNPRASMSAAGVAETWYNAVVKPGGNWRLQDFDAKRDIDAFMTKNELFVASPDLSAFAARGGKLIIYTGQADPAVPLEHTVDYVGRMRQAMGPKADDMMVFFQTPGMAHCRGGGLTNFGKGGGADPDRLLDADLSQQLEAWVEKGVKPTHVVAAQLTSATPPVVERTRPLCAHPKVATLKTGADQNVAASYVCAAPKR